MSREGVIDNLPSNKQGHGCGVVTFHGISCLIGAKEVAFLCSVHYREFTVDLGHQ
jgi:hypothetical protein